MFRVDRHKVFEPIQADLLECDGCPYLKCWVEKYKIGNETESELECLCTGTALDCKRVDEIAEEIDSFMLDNSVIFDLIEEVK